MRRADRSTVRGMRVRLAVAFAAALTLGLAGASGASAAVVVPVVPVFAASTEVGDTAAATLTITNNSSGAEAAGEVTVTALTFTPSCATVGPLCTTPDPGVYQLNGPFTVAASPGAECPTSYTAGAPAATTGAVALTPVGGAPQLDLGESCTISFTATTLKAPVFDADIGTSNVQTYQVASALGTAANAVSATVTGLDLSTVLVPPLRVTKTATPLSRPEPGGAFTFSVTVANNTPVPQTITALTDNIYGNIATQGTCTTAVGTVLAATSGTYSCSFTGNFTGNANASQTDVVTASASDGETTSVDTDDATVTLTNVPPTIDVIKTADPSSLEEPGGTFSFGVIVINTSFEPVTITSMVDDVYGNINGRGTCATGALLAHGGVYSCTFDGDFTGNAGQSQTDTVTVTVTDDDASTGSDTDTATVSLTRRPIHVIIGDTTQDNEQTSTATQTIDQSQTSSGIVVFGGGQSASNSSNTNLNNGQSVGGGDPNSDSVIMGTTTQTNTQFSPTDQRIDQLRVFGSQPVIFGGSQHSSNSSNTNHNNSQDVGGSSFETTTLAKAKAKARAKARMRARVKARALARARARSAAR
jgi:hypothetical protein